MVIVVVVYGKICGKICDKMCGKIEKLSDWNKNWCGSRYGHFWNIGKLFLHLFQSWHSGIMSTTNKSASAAQDPWSKVQFNPPPPTPHTRPT